MRHREFLCLLLELSLVTVCVVGLISAVYGRGGQKAWFLGPFVLTFGALLPTFLKGRNLADIGFRVDRIGLSLRLLGQACLVISPLVICCVLVLRHSGIEPPLRVLVPRDHWLSWLGFQFACVALPEEVFFRGYLLGNMLLLLKMAAGKDCTAIEILGIVLTACIFAVSHVLVLGNVSSMITFFPGLIFGWLFVKTKSLIAPVLFHGLANAGYGLVTTRLV